LTFSAGGQIIRRATEFNQGEEEKGKVKSIAQAISRDTQTIEGAGDPQEILPLTRFLQGAMERRKEGKEHPGGQH
jgi:hypothetical protein